jgi:hypothetical protein
MRLIVEPGRVRRGSRDCRIEATSLFDELPQPVLEARWLTLLEHHPEWLETLSLARPLVLTGPGASGQYTVVAGFETYLSALALVARLARGIRLCSVVVPPELVGEPNGLAALLLGLVTREWIPLSRGALAHIIRRWLSEGAEGPVRVVTVAGLLGITPQAVWAAGSGTRSRPRRATRHARTLGPPPPVGGSQFGDAR